MTDAADRLHSQLTDSGSHDTPAQPEQECEVSPRGVQEFCETVARAATERHDTHSPQRETILHRNSGQGETSVKLG
ncbi:unnamed protein product [Lota lota]